MGFAKKRFGYGFNMFCIPSGVTHTHTHTHTHTTSTHDITGVHISPHILNNFKFHYITINHFI